MSVEVTVHIDAPPERVWRVLVDVERWPEWTPSTLAVKRHDAGAFGLGSSAALDLRGRPTSTWMVTLFEEGRSFSWESPAMPGLRISGGHSVEPEGDGARAVLSLRAKGPLAFVAGRLVARMARENVRAEAEGLKGRCEAGAASKA